MPRLAICLLLLIEGIDSVRFILKIHMFYGWDFFCCFNVLLILCIFLKTIISSQDALGGWRFGGVGVAAAFPLSCSYTPTVAV